MITELAEIRQARELIDREIAHLARHGHDDADRSSCSARWSKCRRCSGNSTSFAGRSDFVSVGTNDLLQFMTASDRGNMLVAGRFDPLSRPFLRALRADRRERPGSADVPVTLCGEMAGNPLAAMALIGLGYRSLSMSAAAIGPVKAMTLALDAGKLAATMRPSARRLGNGEEALRAWRYAFRRGGRHSLLEGLRSNQHRAETDEPMFPKTRSMRSIARLEEIDRQACRNRSTATRWSSSAASGPNSTPIYEAVQHLQKAEAERAGLSPLLRRPGNGDDGARGRSRRRSTQRIVELTEAVRLAAPAEGCCRREERHRSKSGPEPAAARRRCSPATCSGCTQRYADLAWLAGQGAVRKRRRSRRLQGDHRRGHRQGRLRPAEIRIGRAPGSAGSGDRGERAHPHLGGDRGGAAGGGGCRRRYPAGRHSPRHDPGVQRRRPARQHDRFRRSHSAYSDRYHRHRRRRARNIRTATRAMQMLRARLYDLERQKADSERAAARRGPGRQRRPVGAHPDL